jgi:hypothetical protein
MKNILNNKQHRYEKCLTKQPHLVVTKKLQKLAITISQALGFKG